MCPDLSSPPNGNVVYDTNVGDTAEYTCDPGHYAFSGNSQRECLSDGTWSGDPLICLRMLLQILPSHHIMHNIVFSSAFCPDLTDPPNGNHSITGNTVGHIAIFECDPGYELIGDDVLGCQEDGQWTSSVPSCQEIGMTTIITIILWNGSYIYWLEI